MPKEIQIKCQGAQVLDLKEIHDFQGSLKELSKDSYERLKSVIEKDGFSEPISVWKDPKKKQFFCLNGHQRLRVIRTMEKDGWRIPKLPVSLVEASDYKQAKRKVLTLTSQYGEITQQGLYEFLSDAALDWEWAKLNLRLPEIDLAAFELGFIKEIDVAEHTRKLGANELTGDNFTGKHTCPKCGFTFNAGNKDDDKKENPKVPVTKLRKK